MIARKKISKMDHEFLKTEKINLATTYFKAIKQSDINLINSCEWYARRIFGYKRKDLERIMRVFV